MEPIDKEFIDFFESAGRAFAWGDIPPKIIAVLYIEPEAIALEDIAGKTGYSLASVSNAMKHLEAMGFVQRIKKPKTRKVFFYMEKDIIKLNRQKIVVAYENGVKPAMEAVPRIIDKYKDKAKDPQSQKKLEIVQGYYSQMLELEKILQHMIGDISLPPASKHIRP